MEENFGANDWVHQWFLGPSQVPGSRTWPSVEADVDLPNWPAMSEYTVHQSIGPAAYYWGYLAARP